MGALSGFSAEGLGYGWHFVLAGSLTLLGFVWVFWQRKSIALIAAK
jgi:hypothetical protein